MKNWFPLLFTGLSPNSALPAQNKITLDAANAKDTDDYSFEGKTLKVISASKYKNGFVHISLVNIDAHNSQEVILDLGNLKATTVSGRILRSDKIQDHNTFDNPNKIKPQTFSGAGLNGNNLTVRMPAFSVVVLELK